MRPSFFLRSLIVGVVALNGVSIALAQTSQVTYPIAELDNCSSREACKAYCATPKIACVDFAEKQKIVSSEEAQTMRTAIEKGKTVQQSDPALSRDDLVGAVKPGTNARGSEMRRQAPPRPKVRRPEPKDQGPKINEDKALTAIKQFGGPGGCKDMDSCGAFCDNENNSTVCLAYAKEHGLMDEDDLGKMEKMMNAVGPGGCKGRSCESYCDSPGHEEECLAFAKENDLIPAEELKQIEKMMNVVGPGGCKGRACQKFCEEPANGEACMEFAYKNGMMSEEEYKRAATPGPGGCKGPACAKYCDDPTNSEECSRFYGGGRDRNMEGNDGRVPLDRFDDQGLDDEDMIKFRKGIPTGPGGCKGQECDAYCREPDHGEECRRFFGGLENSEQNMGPRKEFRSNEEGMDYKKGGDIRINRRQMMPPRELEKDGRNMMELINLKPGEEGKGVEDLIRNFRPEDNRNIENFMQPEKRRERPEGGNEGFAPASFENRLGPPLMMEGIQSPQFERSMTPPPFEGSAQPIQPQTGQPGSLGASVIYFFQSILR